jgi:hypothetical protein
MNPLDILAEIINAGNAQGRSSGGGSSGKRPEIVRDILVGGPGQGSGSQERVQFPGVFREGRGSSGNNRPSANDIEDMLGVGRSNPNPPAQPTPAPTPTQRRVETPASRSGGSSSAPHGDIFGQEPAKPTAQDSSASEREQVIVLIRAMIHAAKADGRIDAQEQQAILERVGNTNQETIQFLRQEFANATNARDFAWSVPLGMEAAVYAASIASITIDQQAEVDYLKELAQGLRLSPKVCNQIHQQYGLRPLF